MPAAVDAVAPLTLLDRALSALEWDLSGSHRVNVAGDGFRHRLGRSAGFLYVLSGSVEFRADSPSWVAVQRGDLVVSTLEGDREVRSTSGGVVVDVSFAAASAHPLARASLPATLVVPDFARDEPSMVALIEDLQCGWRTAGNARRAGDAVICSRIATTIASAAVRLWSERGCAPPTWLGSVEDPRIARVIASVHADLARGWTVSELARVATMSRSGFAAHFRETVGLTPLQYVAEARVSEGMTLLGDAAASVAEVAHRVGYGSEPGFTRAFRRRIGISPARWRTAQIEASRLSAAAAHR
ncbi:AraC family transcriptional regulator [Ruania halotolerans]|uniref:AraC family transcriptional regulator n=1 Tax=Ruania halotolerans TaxID=2897773 RepID=UPI001E2DFAA1|nr:AraC family transcriptional regulator [Ruania halotolerans]UFU05899.1 AraC family transcriptional regulator [Ruania halotolerans]